MGSCLSQHKGDADSDQRGPVINNQQLNNLPQHGAESSNRRSRLVDIPLNQRYDGLLKRTIWTHDVTKDGPAPTLRQLGTMRDEFWHTRVTGREEVWSTLRSIVELMLVDPSDDSFNTAQEMLRAAEITVPTGDLCMSAYDLFGNRYKLPRYVVANPTNIREESITRSSSETGRSIHTSSSYKSTLGDGDAHRRRMLKGKAPAHGLGSGWTMDSGPPDLKIATFRMPDTTDHKIEFWTNEPLGDIVLRLMDVAKVDSNQARVKVALHGQLLYLDRPLPSQGWEEKLVMAAFVQEYSNIGSEAHSRRHSGSPLPSPRRFHAVSPPLGMPNPAPQRRGSESGVPQNTENINPVPPVPDTQKD